MKKILQIFAMLLLPVIVPAQNKDLPNPDPNLQLLPAGSYVIAMDNTNQVNQAGDFNLKTYGLIVYLLGHDVKIKWVIRAGKLKDEIDFSANVTKIKPVAGIAANRDFRAGPFVIFAADTTGVALKIDSFYMNPTGGTPIVPLTGNNRPSVYKTTADVTNVDIRYDLSGFKPKAAILMDGGNQKIHVGYMDACGIPDTSWRINLGQNLITSCFTFASEPHNTKVGTPEFDSAIHGIRAFVEFGGNFLAQCAAVELYENHVDHGFLQTATGVTHVNVNNNNDRYTNNDLSFAQYDGYYHATQGGHMQSWELNSTWANKGYMIENDPAIPGGTDNIGASVSKLKDINIRGGMVFYVGNHEFSNITKIEEINGIRMYMNAFLTPVAVNQYCTITPPLFVNWYSFTAIRFGVSVQLEWKTASEFNNKYFYAERSKDGIHFTSFAKIDAVGNSNDIQTYSVLDNQPGTGLFFYRIRQEDNDGKMSYSATRSVSLKGLGGSSISIYPNPGNGIFTVVTSRSDNTPATLMIFDNMGRKVYGQVIRMNGMPTQVDLRQMQAGMYTVVFLAGDASEKITEKLVIIK